MKSGTRRGFSIMEILIATSILLGCIIALSELASLGRKHARSAERLVNAQILCEGKLNDLLCGAESMSPSADQEFEDHKEWFYSIDLVPTEIPGISSLIVEVYPSGEDESVETTTDSENGYLIPLRRFRKPLLRKTATAF